MNIQLICNEDPNTCWVSNNSPEYERQKSASVRVCPIEGAITCPVATSKLAIKHEFHDARTQIQVAPQQLAASRESASAVPRLEFQSFHQY